MTFFPRTAAGDAEFAHEALDGAPRHRVALPVQLTPDLPGAVDTRIGLVDLGDQVLEGGIAHLPG